MKTTLLIILGYLIIFPGIVFSQENGLNYDLAVGFTLSPNTEDVSAFSISPKLEIVYGFQNNWNVGASIGLGYLKLNRINYGTESSFDLGNLIISVGKRKINLIANTLFSVKFKAGIPLATYPGNIPDNRITEFNYNNGNSSFGWKDPFTWLMNIIPITTEFNITTQINNEFSLLIKAEPAYLISINSRPSQFCLSGILGLNTNIGATELRIGWITFYSSLSLENNIHTQNSMFIGTNMNLFSKIYQIDFNLNIDEPNGIIEKTAKPNWGINLKTSF
jgi:hypothetical protein